MTIDSGINPWLDDVNSYSAGQDTAGWRPSKVTGGSGINGKDAAECDGVADHLTVDGTGIMGVELVQFRVDEGGGAEDFQIDEGGGAEDFYVAQPITAGEIHVAIETGISALSGDQTILSFADPNVADKYWRLYLVDDNVAIEASDGGTVDRVIGDTTLSIESVYVIRAKWTGSAYTIWVNGTEQTLSIDSGSNSGKGPGAIGTSNTTIGALVTSAGAADWFEGKIGSDNAAGIVGLNSSEDGAAVHTKMQTIYGVQG